MRKISILAVFASILLASCGNNSNADKAQTENEQKVAEQTGSNYTVDPQISTLKWKGYHKGGFDPRFGTLKSEGLVSVENGILTSGTLTIDMNSLITDENSVDVSKTQGKTAADLDLHLKNADFFDTEKYPTSKFEITGIKAFDIEKDKSSISDANNVISGNLTIKGKTVNVTFPAKVTITENEVRIQSKFSINRQDWGLTYGTEGDPKDWIISQEVDIEFDIVAKNNR